ncbi:MULTISPECIES: MBL fold metallo-hydrolase [unclassified Xanthomonas]|uniref:MBL fold metallo-hydrolase n=1 Tax=unclassified Xanthomonas TaxID=2643310 RepID=UPI00160C1870|nr:MULTISPECIES: MBL fold metallo-hydrolase [unclassified Xanthomonas]MBB4132952.1 L-ascorbate metabolism protein UlaG (beta-lactamase superfamily) [Xanthomonas sp. 3075]MBB5865470.1 L-ascorbate metabolism protein UlaG (beta-lactamase superfamily) [Xanthomonas sp. 3058]
MASSRLPPYADSPQFRGGRFRNVQPLPTVRLSLRERIGLLWAFAFNKPSGTVPSTPLPVQPLTRAQLLAAPDRSLYRLGHSTVLMKLAGGLWLTDPVFSKRASPVPFFGPKRFHAPPIALDDLPALAGVILSHNHYDHLDRATILAVADRVGVFVAPLGVGDLLVRWGVDPAKVRQLDWWDTITLDGLQLTATPSQHFSGRGLFDSGQTLWCSWVIQDGDLRLFFSGDGGYGPHFKTIGEQLGPFDVALIENGAYDHKWPHVHMQPEQSLQAFLDIGGQTLLPIHNGTFDLAMHAWQEPLDRIVALADSADIALVTPRMGERVDVNAPGNRLHWWRQDETAIASDAPVAMR